MRLSLCVAACLFLVATALPSPLFAQAAPSQGDIDAQQTRVSELESEAGRIAGELRETAGTTNVRQAINDVRTKMNELKARDDALEAAITQTGATEEEIKKLAEGAANATVVGVGDVAQEGAEKAAEVEALKRLSKGGGRVLGVAGAAIDVLEYGGKWYYRWRTVRSLRADERATRAHLRVFYQILLAVRTEYNQNLAKLRRLEELRARDRANFAALAGERQKLNDMKAGRNPSRDTDAAGDAALQREEDAYLRDHPRGSIRLSDPKGKRPTRRQGVTLSGAFMPGDWDGPRPIYIGTENALQDQFFAVEDLETGDEFTGADVHVAIGLDDGLAVLVGATRHEIAFHGARDRFDPLGQKLLLPGVNTPGTALGSGVAEGTPGGRNVVENLSYSYDGDMSTFYAMLAHDYDIDEFDLIAYAGLAYSFGDQAQFLSGEIPGYGPAFDFEYATRFDVAVVRGVVGGRATVTPFDSAPWLHLNAGANASLNHADADGLDWLAFNGGVELRRIGEDEFTFGWSAGFGVEADVGPATLFANYRHVEDDTTPVAVRHDDGPSRVEFERSTSRVVMIGLRAAL
jgi:hypothetical protein